MGNGSAAVSDTDPRGLETSDVSFVGIGCRPVLLIADKLMSDI